MPAVVRSWPEERKTTEFTTTRRDFSHRSEVSRERIEPVGLTGSCLSVVRFCPVSRPVVAGFGSSALPACVGRG